VPGHPDYHLENRRTVGTFFIAYATPGTFFTIDQHGTVFWLFIDSIGGASTNTSLVPHNDSKEPIDNGGGSTESCLSHIHKPSSISAAPAAVDASFLQATVQSRQPVHRLWSKKNRTVSSGTFPFFNFDQSLTRQMIQNSIPAGAHRSGSAD